MSEAQRITSVALRHVEATQIPIPEPRNPERERLVKAAANFWSGEIVPELEQSEYLRGQCELIADLTPNTTGDGDAEKHAIREEIVSAVLLQSVPKPRYYAHGRNPDQIGGFRHPFLNGPVIPTVMDRETGNEIAHVVTPETAGLIVEALNLLDQQ